MNNFLEPSIILKILKTLEIKQQKCKYKLMFRTIPYQLKLVFLLNIF